MGVTTQAPPGLSLSKPFPSLNGARKRKGGLRQAQPERTWEKLWMPRLTALLEGYRRFRATGWARERERWSELAEGQSPEVLVIACSDSRVDPATIFDAKPGEMFVIRNVSALVPPYQPDARYHGTSAALEFAVTQLKVNEILVMGHGFCGG